MLSVWLSFFIIHFLLDLQHELIKHSAPILLKKLSQKKCMLIEEIWKTQRNAKINIKIYILRGIK